MSMPRKIRCTVEAITDHGERVYTVDLKPTNPVPSFRPGQFMHVTVDEYDPSGFWPESRVFSIASPPKERTRLRMCYSVKGAYTTKMEKSLEVGKPVWVKLPYGDFVVEGKKDAVLIAGGTGISAFLGFLENLSSKQTSQTHLIYGARSPDLFLFNDLIQKKLQEVPSFQAYFFIENLQDHHRDAEAQSIENADKQSKKSVDASFSVNFSFEKKLLSPCPCASVVNTFPGRISLETLWPRIPDIAKKAFYLSGPPQMLRALTDDLKTRGVPTDQVHMDAWE